MTMKTRWMTRGVSALLAVAAMAACNGGTGVEVDAAASIAASLTKPVEVTLAYGEYERVADAGLGVAFKGVSSDSRCPASVQCVWVGDAAVELELTAAGGKESLVLHTGVEPRSADWNGAKITLLDLSPYPMSAGEPTRASQYEVKLRFEAASR
jgi:hypothetical protein